VQGVHWAHGPVAVGCGPEALAAAGATSVAAFVVSAAVSAMATAASGAPGHGAAPASPSRRVTQFSLRPATCHHSQLSLDFLVVAYLAACDG